MRRQFVEVGDNLTIGQWFDRICRFFEANFQSDRDSLLESGRARSQHEAFRIIKDWAAGNITRVGEISGFDRVRLPNYFAIRPTALDPTCIVSLGKGIDNESAMLSALYESYERWAAEEIPLPFIWCPPSEIRRSYPSTNLVYDSEIIEDHEATIWTIGYDLIGKRPCFIPLINVTFPYPKGLPVSPGLFIDTNGLSSGSTFCESVLNGLLEIIERDSIGKRHLLEANCIDPGSLPGPYLEIVESYEKEGVDIAIFERSIYPDLFVYYVLGRDRRYKFSHFYCYGSGAHLSPAIALRRGITELSQSRVGLISTLRFDVKKLIEENSRMPMQEKWEKMSRWFDIPHRVSFTDRPSGDEKIPVLIAGLVDRIRKAYPGAAIACAPLIFEGPPYACRVYCPAMSQYSDIH
jgi:YcaO-like protein with predicted kinase domain